jgi:hypothetical protein
MDRKLDTIISLLQYLSSVQAPLGYTLGPTHNLSGNGELSVSGILGLAVSLTGIPSKAGKSPADPTFYFDQGWMAAGTADGFNPAVRLGYQHQLIMVPAGTTVVGYSVKPPASATAIELLPPK